MSQTIARRAPAPARVVSRGVVTLTAASAALGAALWVAELFVQTAMAWGLRGEPKPLWFEVLSASVYAAPGAAALAFVIAFVVLERQR